ncbi:MAG: hypothetical protein ACXAB4_02870 [Candidatus Hodarchaeales archaeon]
MAQCSQCKQTANQAIQLTTKDSDPLVFCLNCAINEKLSRMPAKKKTSKQPAGKIIPNSSLQGLSVEATKQFLALNEELEQCAVNIFGSRNFRDILGIPTFLEICSLCNRSLKHAEPFFSPEISTSITGTVDIKICQDCREKKTVRAILELLSGLIIQSQQNLPKTIEKSKQLELELLKTLKEVEEEIRSESKDRQPTNMLLEKYFGLSVKWNLVMLKQMKKWARRYDQLIERAMNEDRLRDQSLKALEIADRISFLAEKELKAKLQRVDARDIQEDVPIIAVQLAEILWGREKRAIMAKNLAPRDEGT